MVELLCKLYGLVRVDGCEYTCEDKGMRIAISVLKHSVVLNSAGGGMSMYPLLVSGLIEYCMSEDGGGRALIVQDANDDELSDIYRVLNMYSYNLEEYPVAEGMLYTTVVLTELGRKDGAA